MGHAETSDAVETVAAGVVCDRALDWAEDRDFAGYDPYDGLNSPYVDRVATNWLTRLVCLHAVNKAPVDLRPVLDVPAERNPKGVALFAMASLNRYRVTGRRGDRQRAARLLRWLDDNRSPGYDEAAWGYNFDWQNGRKFFLPAYHPSIVVTVFGGRAFLSYYEVTGEPWALDVARSAAAFVRTHINRETVDGTEVFTYTPHDSFVLVNTNALAAGFFHRLAGHTGDESLAARARTLFEFVVDAQADSGGWYYAVPADESHLSHDNFHTGFVLESLYEYASDCPEGHPASEAYRTGMRFYREQLFDDDGAPRFESDQRYPYDAHAAAQGILTFVQRGAERDHRLARDIYRWSLRNLFDDDGYFYRRVGRVLTDETPYMRWSQAWMCRALSALELQAGSGGGGGHTTDDGRGADPNPSPSG